MSEIHFKYSLGDRVRFVGQPVGSWDRMASIAPRTIVSRMFTDGELGLGIKYALDMGQWGSKYFSEAELELAR